jgi:hypothetical protein
MAGKFMNVNHSPAIPILKNLMAEGQLSVAPTEFLKHQYMQAKINISGTTMYIEAQGGAIPMDGGLPLNYIIYTRPPLGESGTSVRASQVVKVPLEGLETRVMELAESFGSFSGALRFVPVRKEDDCIVLRAMLDISKSGTSAGASLPQLGETIQMLDKIRGLDARPAAPPGPRKSISQEDIMKTLIASGLWDVSTQRFKTKGDNEYMQIVDRGTGHTILYAYQEIKGKKDDRSKSIAAADKFPTFCVVQTHDIIWVSMLPASPNIASDIANASFAGARLPGLRTTGSMGSAMVKIPASLLDSPNLIESKYEELERALGARGAQNLNVCCGINERDPTIVRITLEDRQCYVANVIISDLYAAIEVFAESRAVPNGLLRRKR